MWPHQEEIPDARIKDIKALGVNIIHADETGGIAKVIKKFRRTLVELKRTGWEQQEFSLEGNPVLIFRKGEKTICAPNHSEIIITPAAFGNIAKEAIEQLPKGVKIDTFVGTLGNGATVKGISEVLRAAFGDITVIGIEHVASPTNAIRKLRAVYGEELLRQKFREIYGFEMPEKENLSYHDSFGASTPGYEPLFVEIDKINEIVLVKDEWRNLKRRVNIYAVMDNNPVNLIGNTSAENLYVAYMLVSVAKWHNQNILVIFYDKADQYADFPPERKTYKYPITGPPPQDEIPYSIFSMKRQTREPLKAFGEI